MAATMIDALNLCNICDAAPAVTPAGYCAECADEPQAPAGPTPAMVAEACARLKVELEAAAPAIAAMLADDDEIVLDITSAMLADEVAPLLSGAAAIVDGQLVFPAYEAQTIVDALTHRIKVGTAANRGGFMYRANQLRALRAEVAVEVPGVTLRRSTSPKASTPRAPRVDRVEAMRAELAAARAAKAAHDAARRDG